MDGVTGLNFVFMKAKRVLGWMMENISLLDFYLPLEAVFFLFVSFFSWLCWSVYLERKNANIVRLQEWIISHLITTVFIFLSSKIPQFIHPMTMSTTMNVLQMTTHKKKLKHLRYIASLCYLFKDNRYSFFRLRFLCAASFLHQNSSIYLFMRIKRKKTK